MSSLSHGELMSISHGELMSSLAFSEDGLYSNCGTLAALFTAPQTPQENSVPATPDNSFAWSPCTYTLTTPEGAWPTSFSTVTPPSVSMERLPLATASGWSWHKNHQLPRLSVSCGAPPPEGSACLMSAVTVDVLTHTAHEAGLEGGTLQPLVNGACSFSSLTFKTTSYNLKGKPIHLMASLLVRERDRLCIAASRLSPPLLVDARKRQSKEDKSGRAAEAAASALPGQGHSLLPFAPVLLERKLEKVDRESARREIDDSLDGLRAYLSALNIRNKCKHPLFLVLRFNSCVGLWYDTALRGDPLADDASFCAMMRELSSLDGKGTPPNSGAAGEPARLAPFVIAIKSLHGAGACHLGCPVQLPSSVSLPHASSLPSTYRELCDHQLTTLRRTYCRLYCSHTSGSSPPSILGGTTLLGPACPLLKQNSRPVLIGGPPCACGEFGSGDASAAQPHQRHAAALLASARQMVLEDQATEVNGDADGGAEVVAADNECPEREWEAGLLLLAESLALHCATRSSAEIVAFMRHDEARATKRHSGVKPGGDHAPDDAPSDHAHPTAPALAGEGSLQPG